MPKSNSERRKSYGKKFLHGDMRAGETLREQVLFRQPQVCSTCAQEEKEQEGCWREVNH